MHELERAKAKYDTLKYITEKYHIDSLRQRADVAEAIRDCYKAGITRKEVADALGLDPSRITRLVLGNYVPSEGHVERSESNYHRVPAPSTGPPPSEAQEATQGSEVKTLSSPVPCYYCGDGATYQIQWENGKMIYVCGKHKPHE
jgi:hypothetical protein